MLLENNLSIEASKRKGQRVVILVQLYLVELLLNETEEEKKRCQANQKRKQN